MHYRRQEEFLNQIGTSLNTWHVHSSIVSPIYQTSDTTFFSPPTSENCAYKLAKRCSFFLRLYLSLSQLVATLSIHKFLHINAKKGRKWWRNHKVCFIPSSRPILHFFDLVKGNSVYTGAVWDFFRLTDLHLAPTLTTRVSDSPHRNDKTNYSGTIHFLLQYSWLWFIKELLKILRCLWILACLQPAWSVHPSFSFLSKSEQSFYLANNSQHIFEMHKHLLVSWKELYSPLINRKRCPFFSFAMGAAVSSTSVLLSTQTTKKYLKAWE